MNTETRGAILFGAYALTLTLAMAAAAAGAGRSVVFGLIGLGLIAMVVAGVGPTVVDVFRSRQH